MAGSHDVIAASFAAWNAQDRTAFCACHTDDVRYHVPEAVPFAGTWHGHDQLLAFAEQVWALFGGIQSIVEKLIGDGDRVIARGHHVSTSPDGTVLSVPFVHALSLRDGRICDVRQQLDSGLVVEAVAAQLAGAPAESVKR